MRGLYSWYNSYNLSDYVIKKEEDKLTLELALAGKSKDDVKISIEDNLIYIDTSDDTKRFRASDELDLTDIKADMKHGLLSVKIPYRKSRKQLIKIN